MSCLLGPEHVGHELLGRPAAHVEKVRPLFGGELEENPGQFRGWNAIAVRGDPRDDPRNRVITHATLWVLAPIGMKDSRCVGHDYHKA